MGESRVGALTIDHIEGGGRQHRKQLGIVGSLYRWLKANQFPTGFRVLCSNCNWLAYLETKPKPRFEYRSRWAQSVKARVMLALGGRCVECDKTDLRILTVSHINNDGAEHRRRLGRYGTRFYTAILQSQVFDGLECRCFSCNDALSR